MKIDKLIGIKEEQLKLLKLIKRNSVLQQKEYYVTKLDNNNYRLVRTKGNMLIKIDRLSRINSYLNIRGMQNRTVYDAGICLNLKR